MSSLRTFGALAVFLLLHGCATLAPDRPGSQILWEVRDARHVVYLLGSVHVMPESVYPLAPQMEAAFADSRELVLELDLSGQRSDRVGEDLEKLGRYPRGDSLKKHLSKPAREFLTQLLPAFGTSFEEVQPYRPWYLADALSARYLHETGLRSENGVDFYFLRKAREAGKKISGLEDVSAQAGIYGADNDAEAEHYLMSTLITLEPVAKTIRGMAKAWRRGDLGALEELIEEQAASDPEGSERLFTIRNRAWLPRIERKIRGSDNVLIIVGAGHLIGPRGIIAMLRERGYVVKRL